MQQQFQQLRTELVQQFPERSTVIDGSLCAVLAGEHVLLLGPPGTAKSALVRSIAQAFGGTYFERLVTKFSTPEELFGPISLKALEQDRFTRITNGKLPEAQFAFLDELARGNSAILNACLSLMNERLYHNDGQPVPVPLVSLFSATNSLGDENSRELEALFDRFLLRFDVNYLLRPSHLKMVLTAQEPKASVQLDMKTLHAAQAQVAKVKVGDTTVDALIGIRDALKAEGIVASDRRWKKGLKLTQASAWAAGEKQTTPEDLILLTDSLWREPKERPKVAKIVGRVADPASAQAQEILDAARESSDKVHALKAGDRKQYIAQAANALEQFNQQMQKLEKLAAGGGRRAREAIKEASHEITSMHEELARTVSSGLGLRRAAGK